MVITKKDLLENILLETKKTEQEAIDILKRLEVQNPQSIVARFKSIDREVNGILLPFMAKAYHQTGGEEELVAGVFRTIVELMKDDKIRSFKFDNQYNYVVNGETKENFNRLSEYVHGLEYTHNLNRGAKEFENKIKEKVNTDEGVDPMWENENFAIYDGNNIETCIKIGKGKLTGKNYSFCIGAYGSQNQWQSYRDRDGASFYYLLDKNLTYDDPFHIIVWMPTENDDVLVTHVPNATSVESNFDKSYAMDKYGMGIRDYLKKNGVPIDKVLNKVPKTDEEEKITKLLRYSKESLEWFKSLGKEADSMGLYPDLTTAQKTYKLMDQYIGRGHLLSNEQFEWLFKNRNPIKGGPFMLLKKYLDIGQSIPKDQFEMLIQDNEEGKELKESILKEFKRFL